MRTKGFLGSIIDVAANEALTFDDPDTGKYVIALLKNLDADLTTQGYNPNDEVIKAVEQLEKHLDSLFDFEEDEEESEDEEAEYEDEEEKDPITEELTEFEEE